MARELSRSKSEGYSPEYLQERAERRRFEDLLTEITKDVVALNESDTHFSIISTWWMEEMRRLKARRHQSSMRESWNECKTVNTTRSVSSGETCGVTESESVTESSGVSYGESTTESRGVNYGESSSTGESKDEAE